MDGSKVVHAGDVYREGFRPPRLDKSAANALVHVGDEQWELVSGTAEGNVTKATYATDDLRWTVVYRARCFEDASKAAKFNAGVPEGEKLSLECVLTFFPCPRL